MILDRRMMKELEQTYRKSIPADLRKYLLSTYAEEPFPHEFSEQDLYANIQRDIRDYEAGELDITVKSPSLRWSEERNYLKKLYIEKSREVRDLEDYVSKMEQVLIEHGLKPPRMASGLVNYEY
jgi:hypothetical protein